jgi:plasmid stability protein
MIALPSSLAFDEAVKDSLRVRAARNRRSLEAELRSILTEAAARAGVEEVNLAEAIRRRFAPFGGVELPIPARELAEEPPSFD